MRYSLLTLYKQQSTVVALELRPNFFESITTFLLKTYFKWAAKISTYSQKIHPTRKYEMKLRFLREIREFIIDKEQYNQILERVSHELGF